MLVCPESQRVWTLQSASEQKCRGTGSNSKISGVLQQTIFSTQTQQPVETYLGPEHLEHLPKHRVFQNGDTRDNKNLPTEVGEVGPSVGPSVENPDLVCQETGNSQSLTHPRPA